MTDFISKYFTPLAIFGFLLSLFIAGSTYHPDLRAFALASKFIHSGEIVSFYDHVSELPADHTYKQVYGDNIFIYPPLAYLYPATLHLVTAHITDSLIDDMITQDSVISQDSVFDIRLIFLKLPSLLAMLAIFLVLPKLFDRPNQARLAQLVFLFLPANLLVSSGMGQADTALTLFLTLSLLAIRSGNFAVVSLCLALSALFKPASLVLLPLLFIYLLFNRGLKSAILSLAPGVAVWSLIIAPFVLSSPAFRMYAFLASLSDKTTFSGIEIATGTVIPWFYIVFALVSLLLATKKLSLVDSLFTVLLASLAFNHFHPQWFLWLTPFLLFMAFRESQKLIYILAPILAWTLIWLSFEPSLHLGIFLATREIFPATMTSPLDVPILVSLARAFLPALLVYHLWSSSTK
jgi:hypothetical protein